jgi:hypothetical protein
VGSGGVVNPAGVEMQQLQQAEVLYQTQLEQLQLMGFSNRQANLRGEREREYGEREKERKREREREMTLSCSIYTYSSC